MRKEDMKVGQLVKVTAYCGGLFNSCWEGKMGFITEFDDYHVTVNFDGETDYGDLDNVELVADVGGIVAPTSVRDAIANVEAALAALKALVG
jgi:hypothetical protein